MNLHRLVFSNNPTGIEKLLADPKCDPQASYRGETALTLAIKLNHVECIRVLLGSKNKAGEKPLGKNIHALASLKNTSGWTPLQESVSFGNRQVIEMVYRAQRKNTAKWLETNGADLLAQLAQDLSDFSLEMKWKFKSQIPFIASLCPSDTYTIRKRGASFRIDTSLVGFENLTWVRGKVSLIYCAKGNFNFHTVGRLVLCDHDTKTRQLIWPSDFSLSDSDVQDECSVLLNTPIRAPPDFISTDLLVKRVQSGFLWAKPKTDLIGGIECDVYKFDKFHIITRIRREHLLVDPPTSMRKMELLQEENERINALKLMNKPKVVAPKTQFKIANPDDECTLDSSERDISDLERRMNECKPGFRIDEAELDYEEYTATRDAFAQFNTFRGSLVEPTPYPIKVEEYFSDCTLNIELGREQVITEHRHDLTSSIWITDSPQVIEIIKVDTLKPLIELMGMGANGHLHALLDLFNLKGMPTGFPLQIELPIGVLPLSAVVSFENIEKLQTETMDSAQMFCIPEEYIEGDVIKNRDD